MENWPTVNPIGPFENYCDGYGMPGASGLGYVSTMKLATGIADVSDYQGDEVLEGIVAYDKAEKANAYIGQINMGTASSFCGTMGRLWGYDLAVAPGLYDDLLMTATQWNGDDLPVYSATPLLEATVALFGTEDSRRFPPAPGAYVVCANKSQTTQVSDDVSAVWCYIAISIATDRDTMADLFIEDAGNYPPPEPTGQPIDEWLESHVVEVVNSIVACGKDQSVVFKETFIGWDYVEMPAQSVGTALTCAPYVTLAQNAVPEGMSFDSLLGMSLGEWSELAGPGVGGSG